MAASVTAAQSSATAAASSATAAATSASSAATSANSAAVSAASAAAAVTTAIQASTVDAKGDLIVGTANDTVSRLAAASTNGYLLAVNSATATGLEWQAAPAGYLAPTIGTTVITSGTTVSTITGLTLSNATLSGTLTASSSTGTSGQYLRSTGTGVQWAAVIQPSDYSAKGVILVGTGSGTFTAQTVGTNGQVLTANSAQADGVEWTTINALPSQTGNAGKYLTTDGSTASWAVITTDPTPTAFLLMGA